MPRCHSLSELDQRKVNSFPDNGLIVPYLETNNELLGKEREQFDVSLDEAKRTTSVVSVSREHNYSSHSVKMKFGGKFGSLKKNPEDAKSDNPSSVKTSRDVVKSIDSKDTDRSSSSGEKCKGTLKEAQGMKSHFERTEQRLSDMGGKENWEDCWLSASFPPPSLSGFPTFLQGRTSRGTARPGSSRPSSVVSIGELDRWLFPGDNASPTITSGQVVKTVSTPWMLSPTVTSTHSSPPKLTTLASPGGHGVALASPRPVLPQTNHHMYLSPHRSIVDARAGMSPEPLFTSTPKPSTASIKYFNSDFISSQRGMESVSYSGDDTTIPGPQDCHEDLGRLKPLEGIPLEQQSAPATMSQSTFQKLPETEHVCPKVRSGGKCTHPPAFGDEPSPTIMSTSSSQSSTLPPYLMRSKAAAASSKLLCKPMVHPADICSPGQGLVNMEQVGPTSVQRLSDLQSGDSTNDSSTNPSASLTHHVPLHQLQTIPSSGEGIQACLAPSKPNSSFQGLPQSPHGIPVVGSGLSTGPSKSLPRSLQSIPAVSSGLGTGPSKLWKSPLVQQIQQRMQQRLPPSGIAYTLNGTTYTIHVRPRTGNPTPSGTSSAGYIPPLNINPTTPVGSWNRCHQEAVCRMRSPLGGPHPLQVAHGPAPGCTPRFATQNNPNPDTKAASLGSVSSSGRVNGVIAREACGSSNAEVPSTVPQHRPWIFPCPVVQGLSVSGDTLPPRQTNCNDFITSG
eukprot:XP_011664623.1 PREDICTED: uncharacterized protein LOC100890807 [Strongylocentrotus purpuratus]